VTFPLLKCLVGMIAFFIGIAVSNHTILDCVELKLSCQAYREENWVECGPGMTESFGTDCKCETAVRDCYSQEEMEVCDDNASSCHTVLRCESCEDVKIAFEEFLRETAGGVVFLGVLTFVLAAGTHCVANRIGKRSYNKQGCYCADFKTMSVFYLTDPLTALAVLDILLMIGCGIIANQKIGIAGRVGQVCKRDADDFDDAMAYAPTTMQNLCNYHKMLNNIAGFVVLLLLITLLNVLYSLWGIAIGWDDGSQSMDEEVGTNMDAAVIGAMADSVDNRGGIAKMPLPGGEGRMTLPIQSKSGTENKKLHGGRAAPEHHDLAANDLDQDAIQLDLPDKLEAQAI
jgi:hypothetical protein